MSQSLLEHHDVDPNQTEKIQKLKDRGYTHAEIADQLGIHKSTVSRKLSGKRGSGANP